MKRFTFCFFLILILATPSGSSAQRVMIDQIVKQSETGEIKGCGIEVVATDGEANGVQMQATLYSLGNLNWNLVVHLLVGRIDEDSEFVQDNVVNASIINKKFGEIRIISEGRDVSQESLEGRYPLWIVNYMLSDTTAISFQTLEKPDGYIEIASSAEKLKEYREGCFNEMRGMFREHYRQVHGNTACLDDPEGC